MMMKLRVVGFEGPFLFVIRLTTKGRHAIDERSLSRHFSLFDEFPNLTDTAYSFFFRKANIGSFCETSKGLGRKISCKWPFFLQVILFVISTLQKNYCYPIIKKQRPASCQETSRMLCKSENSFSYFTFATIALNASG